MVQRRWKRHLLLPGGKVRKSDRYFRFVEWSDEDQIYIGYCPDLFYGGCCHSTDPVKAFAELCEIVDEDVTERARAGEPLPQVKTRAPAMAA